MAYRPVAWWSFALALAIVAAPALFLEEADERWAWAYVGVILLGMGILQWSGLSAFSAYLNQALKG